MSYLPLVAILLLWATVASAQTESARISGRVTDPTDAVIAGAECKITNLETNVSTIATTNEEGIYVIPDLRPATYRLIIQKEGFRSVVQPKLQLYVQDAVNENFKLALGSVSETSTVSSTDTVLQTDSPAVSTVVDREFVQNMPLNGRTFQSLLALTPGYALATPSYAAGGFALGQFSLNGQRADANYFTVDGVSVNFSIVGSGQSTGGTIPAFTIQGGTNGLVPLDAMQEFRVQSSSFTPDFGRTPGAQVSIVTRSGNNAVHGDVFDYLRNDDFDARNYFDAPPLPKPPLRQNNFGGAVGGHILKDRLFYFFSYEGLRLLLPQTQSGNFYTAAARADVAPVYQPLVAATPLPDGPLNPDGLTAPLTMTYSDPANFDSYSLRIDFNPNSRTSIFGRFNHAPSTESTHEYSRLLNYGANVDNLTVGATTSFGPGRLNDFRANWSRTNAPTWYSMVPFYGAVPPPLSTMYPPGYNSNTYRFVFLGAGDGEVENGRTVDSQRQLEFADTFSVSSGTHLFKFGADMRQLTPTSGGSAGVLVISSHSQEQAGIAGSVGLFNNATVTGRTYNYSFFAQDVWKATRRLTLTYGLRWEINTPFESITPGKPLYDVNSIFNSLPFGLVPASHLWHTRFNNFAPRVGVSYQATPQTVVRGGFGLFYDIGFGGGIAGTAYNFPYEATHFGIGPVPFDLSSPIFAPPPFTTVPNASTAYIDAVDPNLQLPLVYEWNAALERAFGRNQSLSVTYVGSHGTRLLREDTIVNNPTGSPEIFATHNADWSNYNALQVQFQRRMSRGLQALASYTLANSKDTNSTDVCQCTYTNSLKNVNPAADYGPSDFDVRQAFSAAVSYEIPSPKLGKVGRALFGDWALYGVLHVSSALPFNLVAFGYSPAYGYYYYTRPDVVPGVPFYIPAPGQPGGRILNKAAFTNPPDGKQGDLPRNYFRGFPISQTDLAIGRRFAFTERISLYFRAEYFNVLNHPMFAPPSANFNNFLRNGGFGQITATLNNGIGGGPGNLSPLYEIGGPRSGQLSLTLAF